MGLRRFFGSRIESIEHLIMLPEIVYVDNFETARKLRSKVNPKRYAIVHHPALVEEKGGSIFIDFTYFNGVRIPADRVSYSLSRFYNDQFIGFEELKSSLDSLEQRIEESHAYRAATVARLEEAARGLYGGNNGADAEQIISLIKEITDMQFEYPEHFIREAIQNADGSSSDKAVNRIDVYIDRENRIVRVEDLGRGMSQHEMNEYFFNLYRSMNEALEHAAGKFGIGALSFFGMRHEYVRVESVPETGVGGIAEIDANLYREEFRGAQREKGTSVEIKFSQDSGIDFDKVLSILKGDCRFVETPIYLHENDSVVRINEELSFPNAAQFNEKNIEGFVYLVDGKGTLDLLDHRIRLASIDTIGYSGVVNCSDLETVFSRDTVVENPVLEEVLRFAELKAKELRGNGHEKLSLEQRLVNYRRFLTSTAFNEDGSPNEEWLRENYSIFENAQITFYLEPGSLIHSLAKLPLKGICKLYNSSFGKIFGLLPNFFKERHEPFGSLSVYVPYSLIGSSLIPTSIIMDETGPKDIGGYVFLAGVSIMLVPYTGLVESLTKFHAKRAMINSYDRSINGTLTDEWSAKAAAVKVAKRISRPIARVGAGIVLLGAAVLATVSYLPISGGGESNFISGLFVNRDSSQSGIDYMTTGELAKLLNDYEAKAKGNAEGYVSTDTSNVLDIASIGMVWKDIEPANIGLAVIGINPQLPNILYQYQQADLTLEQKVSIVMNYIQNNFEYDAIPEEVGHGYPDPIQALLQERKAICTGGNSLAAWMLYNLGAYDVREASGTLNGVPHLWLQVNYGSDTEPNWVTTDFTPTDLSERLENLLAERDGEGSSISIPDISIPVKFSDIQYFLGAAGVLSLAGIYFASRRRNYSTYSGPISKEQESVVNDIQQHLQGAEPSIRVFYCSELQNGSELFVLRKGIVALNPSKQDYDPELVALSYAVKVLKDADLADSISAELAG